MNFLKRLDNSLITSLDPLAEEFNQLCEVATWGEPENPDKVYKNFIDRRLYDQQLHRSGNKTLYSWLKPGKNGPSRLEDAWMRQFRYAESRPDVAAKVLRDATDLFKYANENSDLQQATPGASFQELLESAHKQLVAFLTSYSGRSQEDANTPKFRKAFKRFVTQTAGKFFSDAATIGTLQNILDAVGIQGSIQDAVGRGEADPPASDDTPETPPEVGDVRAASEPEAATTRTPETPPEVAAVPGAPERDQTEQHPKYTKGSKNVALVRVSEDTALVRLRGLQKGQATYKYFTTSGQDLARVTGNSELDEGNIWNYVEMTYNSNPRQFLSQLVPNSRDAWDQFETEARTRRPADFLGYLKQQVGESHKDLLINAFRRQDPQDDSGLFHVIAGLSNENVSDLFDSYKMEKIKRGMGSPDVAQYLGKQRRRFNPLEGEETDEDIIAENIGSNLGQWLQDQQRKLGRKFEREDVKFAKLALQYDRMAEHIAQDTGKFAQKLADVGVDTSKFPQLNAQQMDTTDEQGALARPEASPEQEPSSTRGIVPDPKRGRVRTREALRGREIEPEKRQRPAPKGRGYWLRKQARERGDEPGEMDLPDDIPTRPQHEPEEVGELGRTSPERKQKEMGKMLSFLRAPHINRILKAIVPEKHRGLVDRYVKPISQAKTGQELKQHLEGISGRDWSVLKAYIKMAVEHAQKPYDQGQEKGLGGFLKGVGGRLRKRLGLTREDYARAILSNLLIEEARMHSNDCANAALKMYIVECKKFNQSKVNAVNNKLFYKMISESFRVCLDYDRLLKESGLDFGLHCEYDGKDIFGSLVNMICQTADPLSNVGWEELTSDPKLMIESYHKELISKIT